MNLNITVREDELELIDRAKQEHPFYKSRADVLRDGLRHLVRERWPDELTEEEMEMILTGEDPRDDPEGRVQEARSEQ